MKIKICGITNIDDALLASELGADALGFIFVKTSPRYINPAAAQKIIHSLPSFVTPVGVVADQEKDEILKLIKETGIRLVQFHGCESPDQLINYPVPVCKSFRVHKGFNLQALMRYKVSEYLLDTFVEGVPGGTGRTFDWEIAVAAKAYGRIILAGGLKPSNITEAIKNVQPYAVDVNSGVEERPGKKSHALITELFEKIRKI